MHEYFFMLQTVWNKAKQYVLTNCWHWRCCTCNLCCWGNKGVRAVSCIWDWKTFPIHCNPRTYFKTWCRQIKSFVCLSRCNVLWQGLILWWERKIKGLEHMDCVPNSDVGLFRTWYRESKSVPRCMWQDWAICCVHVWKEQWQQWMQQGKTVLPTMQISSIHRMFFVSTLYVQPIKQPTCSLSSICLGAVSPPVSYTHLTLPTKIGV